MKNTVLILILYFLFVTYNSFGQFECSIPELKSEEDIPDAYLYEPNTNTPIKYLRVNIHFMLKEQGTSGYPGNFTSHDDGNGNSGYTGYDYANDLINMANYRLSNNHQMNLPPNNNTAVLPRQYRYVLNGVFFHEDNYYYYWPSVPTIYNINTGNAINVYLIQLENDSANGGGQASMTDDRYVVIKGAWNGYVGNYPNTADALWVNAQTLNHEIGHNLSLLHTVLYTFQQATCCYDNSCDDYCSDTPTARDMLNLNGYSPCCGWNTEGTWYCTNNMMDYSGDDAITPLQLGREHWTIANEMYQYKTCYYTNSSLNITNFTDNMAYIANDVQIPSTANILVNNNKALFINCETFEINGPIEIDVGSVFWVNPVVSCN